MRHIANRTRISTATLVGMAVLTGWVPLAGPVVVGWLCGSTAESVMSAFRNALAPAVAVILLFTVLSVVPMPLAGQTVTAGLLVYVGIANALLLLAAATLRAPRGWPTAALLAGAATVAVLPSLTVAANLIRALRPQAVAAPASAGNSCPDHLVQIYKALRLYADSWDGNLPPTTGWAVAIKPNVAKDEWLTCPQAGGTTPGYGYAMNPAVGGRALSALTPTESTPLVYDSSVIPQNAEPGLSSKPKPGRHGGKNYILFADGSVKAQ